MAHPAAPSLALRTASPPLDWGLPAVPEPEGYSSSSPAPSPDSCGLSPPARAPRRGPAGRRGSGVAGGPRQSASEREKLRMRRLAQAMHRLRHYLPPALAPAGQSLTKIETLRLATRYIAHLSALLGLSEEVLLLRRGAAPRHCPLCPQGLGCCQPPHPRLCPPAPWDASPPSSEGWGSPPDLHGALDAGMGTWGPLSTGPVMETCPELHGVPDMEMGLWSSPSYSPTAGSPPALHGAPASSVSSWPSPPHCAVAGTSPDHPGDPILDGGLLLPDSVDAEMVTQDISADLLSLLEALLPPQLQH
ncbi:mesoderm posterior protein 1 [Coturnix japonica]|uniref:Mesoderm posterior bHLH transcription factor 1 n=1 Tax=Coturnix japonica TaxID=93934 RepID=A0A8C2UDN3_COTJA|nr:mesoderm posterior protein 1 [Coturnix japonica]